MQESKEVTKLVSLGENGEKSTKAHLFKTNDVVS